MILYINGDSHAAGVECVTPHAWAEDDGALWGYGKGPHPDNEAASFGAVLADLLNFERINQSQGGGSNARILRTTREWVAQNKHQLDQVFMLIQWSTWERTEWYYKDEWWQVNASGTDHVPQELENQYRRYIVDIDWDTVTRQAHQDIWQLHQELEALNIPHLFFNGNSHFGGSHLENNLTVPIITAQYDWGTCYMDPYNLDQTYTSVLKNNGFQTVAPNSYHFGSDAHCFWAKHVLQYMIDNQLVSADEIPTD